MPASQYAIGEIALRIGAALACGVAVGLNRDLHGKPAGLRTFGLMALGTSVLAVAFADATDPSALGRVVQGIMTGIGFLGAGMILHPSNSFEVQGLTTAAAVWLTAALSMMCGIGRIPLALGVLVVALVLLAVGRPVERQFERWFGDSSVLVRKERDQSPKPD